MKPIPKTLVRDSMFNARRRMLSRQNPDSKSGFDVPLPRTSILHPLSAILVLVLLLLISSGGTKAQPVITPTINLQHQAVHVGSNTFFAITAAGTGPLSYQWQLDRQDLPGQTNTILSLDAVQPADEGDYTVVVTNAAGARTSEPARLWVVPPASAFIREDFTNGTFRYPYYYLMPANYDPARSYPLVLTIHGGGGDEISFTNGAGGPPGWLGYANYAVLKVFASYRQQAMDPVINVWPTVCAGDSTIPWPIQYVWQMTNLLDSLIARFNVDTNRLYVGGLSMGFTAAWDLLGLRPAFFAGAEIMAGGQGSTPASAIKGVPLWAFCASDDEYGWAGPTRQAIRALRLAGGSPLYTEYASGGHNGGIAMGMSTPVVVNWLLGQRRGTAPTNEPVLSITSPTGEAVHCTGAATVSLAGFAAALAQPVTLVSWTNLANNVKGAATGTNIWSTAPIPLVANRTNLIIVAGTTAAWAPAYGGNTTFNDTLAVICYPLRATLARQGPNAILNWTGGGAPYCVQRATDLAAGHWTDLLTNATPPVSLPLDAPIGFYRIVGQ